MLKRTPSQDLNYDYSRSKWNDALTIFTESVHKPDTRLTSCAHNQECYNELMWIRGHVIEYLQTLRK